MTFEDIYKTLYPDIDPELDDLYEELLTFYYAGLVEGCRLEKQEWLDICKEQDES